MHLPKLVMSCIAVTGVCVAQSITIRGTVRDTCGNAVSGAVVTLGEADVQTTTDVNGKFVLGGTAAAIHRYSGSSSMASTTLPIGIPGFCLRTHEPTTRESSEQDNGTCRSGAHDYLLTATKNGFLVNRSIVRGSDTGSVAIRMLPSAGEFADIDGNRYQSVRIGRQIWAVENLKTTRYNDGTAITHVPDSAGWLTIYTTGAPTAAYAVFGNTSAKDAKYGVFYNWYAVKTGKLAPKEWRIPSDTDWDTLQNYLIRHGYNYNGSTTANLIAKSMAAQWDWDSSTIDGAVGNDLRQNNRSGFSALPGGIRHWGGSYYSLFLEKKLTYWWSSTEYDSTRAWHRWLDSQNSHFERTFHHKNTGFPVRVVRDAL